MPSEAETKKPSRKPANTAFRQQRLRAWQPILTPKTVLPIFFAIGAIFIPIGIGLYIAADRVKQIQFDYTACADVTPSTTFAAPVQSMVWTPATNTCTITYTVDSTFSKPVFLYYRLTSFYQNHRRYVKSFDTNQLRGDLIQNADTLGENCQPLKGPSSTAASKPQYYPCGLIANSMFSDNIKNPVLTSTSAAYEFKEKGIAWPSDGSKYKNSKWFAQTPVPSSGVGSEQWVRENILPPPQWRVGFKWMGYDQGYNLTNFPNLETWERFQVWMRTAGLPNFRKLWGRNDDQDMAAGTYTLEINSNFEVARYGGTKSIVISTVSIIGGKNTFLGIAYIVVGIICWAFGLLFLVRHMVKPRKLGDHTYLSWNKTAAPPTTPVVGAGQGYSSGVNGGMSNGGMSQRPGFSNVVGQAVQMQPMS